MARSTTFTRALRKRISERRKRSVRFSYVNEDTKKFVFTINPEAIAVLQEMKEIRAGLWSTIPQPAYVKVNY